MTTTSTKHNDHIAHSNHYRKLLIMAVLSFITMYALMYSMVDSFDNVINNVNQFYMTGLMTAPMILIEMALMGVMYKNKKLNLIISSVSAIALVLCFFLIRKQVNVSDKQFLRSMIPHHAAAILMVKETQMQDPEIQKLARDIISAQQSEIEFMKAKLRQMEK
jgi:uncharacterized protein (DUF305 family)